MKLKFDITIEEYYIVNAILKKHIKDTKVYVFGSRAKYTTRFNSDLDLALEAKEKIDKDLLIDLKEEFNDSDLKYSVDIVDLNHIDHSFKKIIDSEKIEFPLE